MAFFSKHVGLQYVVVALIGIAFRALSFDVSRADGIADQGYPALLARVKRKDLTVDFGALRRAYAQSPAYHPYDPAMTALHHAMEQDARDGDDAAAMRAAERVPAQDYVDIEAHRVLEHGKGPCADFRRAVADGLLQSILNSGDGKSPETAYRVVSIDEEYAVLDRLGLQPVAQSLMERRGHHFDLLLVTGDRAAPIGVYFNVDLPFDEVAGGGVE